MFVLNMFSAIYLSCAFYLFGLGSIIFYRKKDKVGFAFLLLTTSAAIWQIATYFAITASGPVPAELYTKLGYIGVSLMPATLFHFIATFIESKAYNKQIAIAYMISVFILIPLSMAGLFLKGAYHYPWGYWYKATIYHPTFIVYYSALFFYSLYVMFSAMGSAEGVKRNQMLYMLSALVISYCAAFDYLVDYGINLPPLGSIPVIICLTIIAYAIARHRLMGIRIVISKGAAYVIAILAYSVGYAILMTIVGQINFSLMMRYLINIIAILFAGFTFLPFTRYLQTVTSKAFFKDWGGFRAMMGKLAKGLSSSFSRQDISNNISSAFKDKVDDAGTRVLFLDEKSGKYVG